MVYWYRKVMSVATKGRVKEVMAMLKAIHARRPEEAEFEDACKIV